MHRCGAIARKSIESSALLVPISHGFPCNCRAQIRPAYTQEGPISIKESSVLKEADIVYELGAYWATPAKKAGFDVYKAGITHSTRCAHVGFDGEEGMRKVRAEIDRRIALDVAARSLARNRTAA